MRVSVKAEYACIAMLELAASYGEPHPVRVKIIADAHHLKQQFLVQILLQLKSAGLVLSVRGASGGYQLARPPEAISLANIINSMDRPTAPRHDPAVCDQSPAQRALRSVWVDAQAREQRFLEEISLAELVRRLEPSSSLSYQI